MHEMTKSVRVHVFGEMLTKTDELTSTDGRELDEALLTIKTVSKYKKIVNYSEIQLERD